MKRSYPFSIRLPQELLEKLENSLKDGKFPSISEAIRAYVTVGIHVESLKTQIKDPEFLKSIEELKKTEGIFDWIDTLTESQEDAIATALQMKKEQRYGTGTSH